MLARTANSIRFLVLFALGSFVTACAIATPAASLQEAQPSATVAAVTATSTAELAAPSPLPALSTLTPFSVKATPAPSATRLPATPRVALTEARPAPTAASTPVAPTATPVPPPTATPEAPAITLSANANLRSGPGTAYPVIGGGRTGQVLAVLAQYGGWWQTPRGWVSGSLAQPNTAAKTPGQVPVAQTVPAPPTSTPQPQPTHTPEPAAVPPAQAAPAPLAGLPAYGDVVVLGSDTVYPVRARVVRGWGYELVDASAQYDWLIKRDVYGAVAHQFWGDRLYGQHPGGIRITLLDPVYEAGCTGFCLPQAPVPLWNSGRGDYKLGLGYGDGVGSMIFTGCALAPAVHYDPQECFIAVTADGPYLTDVVVSTTIVAHNARLTFADRRTPDFSQAPFTPLLGQAHKEGDQWRWADPFLEVVRTQ